MSHHQLAIVGHLLAIARAGRGPGDLAVAKDALKQIVALQGALSLNEDAILALATALATEAVYGPLDEINSVLTDEVLRLDDGREVDTTGDWPEIVPGSVAEKWRLS